MDLFEYLFLAYLTPQGLFLALCIAMVAGLVKGMVGFALPMILISGLSLMMAPDLALATVILPTLVANGYQAFGQGIGAAWDAVRRFRVFLLVGMVMLVASAQLVTILPQRVLNLLIGGPVVLFCALQLVKWKATLAGPSKRVEVLVGGFAGFIGGMSGIWGPPTVAYLTAINTPKDEQLRVQGVIYGLGAVMLAVAHLQSGVLRIETAPLSALMVVPAMLGMVVGMQIQGRIDQKRFKQVTLFVLLIAGLNLVRRGLF